LSKLREAEEEVKMKDLIVEDLKQSERDGQKALAEALTLYDLVRSQRSRFVTLTQVWAGCAAFYLSQFRRVWKDSLLICISLKKSSGIRGLWWNVHRPGTC
jgi:predicted double-glycine peptidase